ncbi:hypothetical protein ACLOJK_019962, partial [Asimina triloba]
MHVCDFVGFLVQPTAMISAVMNNNTYTGCAALTQPVYPLKLHPISNNIDHFPQGLEQLRSGLLQQQKSFMPSPQPYSQLHLLTPQQQQQLMLHAQQNSNPSAGDIDSRRLRMFLNNRNMVLNKDGQSTHVGDVVPNVGSSLQSASPVLPRGDTEMLKEIWNSFYKDTIFATLTIRDDIDKVNTIPSYRLVKIAQLQQQNSNQQQQLPQQTISSQQSQSSNQNLHQQDKIGAGSVTADGSMSNCFRGNDQASKNQGGRKRKQPVSSSGPANSSGTANTTGPSPSSGPSTPSTHTPGDVIPMPSFQQNSSSSNPVIMFGSDGTGTLTSPPNQLAEMDRFVDDGSLDDNVESFLSHDDVDPRDTVSRCMDGSKGFTFNEVALLHASTSKVVCCHFSSDGKLLASGGHDKKAVLWSMDNLKRNTTLEEHSLLITDVRFSPSMPRLATSSFDKTVRVWDVDNVDPKPNKDLACLVWGSDELSSKLGMAGVVFENPLWARDPGYSLRTFTGHAASVMSLDFHPTKEDLICSCDGDSEIRYWSINNGNCAGVFKGGTSQMRFQPRLGRYLAAAAENVVSILDVETQACRHFLQGHTKLVHSVCWDPSGDYVASVSEDSVRVWSLGSGSEGDCQSLELWNTAENKTMTLPAHDGLIAAVAASNVLGLVASASHDKFIKLWKGQLDTY